MQIGIIVNPRKDNVSTLITKIDRFAGRIVKKAKFYICTYNSTYTANSFENLIVESEKNLLKKSDLIITLGGDGTLLRTVTKMHQASNKKIMGVNLGGLGFLADTPAESVTSHIENFINSNYFLDERTLIECTPENGINSNKKKIIALNDVVIDKAGFSRVIQIDIKIDGKSLNSYIADGLIISTPTGSTGYSLSAGGPIVSPHSKVILLNPICPHSLTNRPMVIPDESEIQVRVWTENDSFSLLSDGDTQGKFPSGTSLILRKSAETVGFVKVKSQDFFKTLNKKMRWGEDFRNKKRWTYQKNNNADN
ncbi:MAG: NAD(+)/NADH kinase [Calditrichaeota bacterium]|nr:NAD(+)/NADH kinase [Calditrichota bacterium]